MRVNTKVTQITLIFIGLILLLATYILYPKIIKKKSIDQLSKMDLEISETITDKDGVVSETQNIFHNVEYQGLYGIDSSFVVKSEEAFVSEDSPDLVHMNNLLVILYLKDNRKVQITSLKGKYNKRTHDIFCEQDVKATDNETTIWSENLDLLSTEDSAKVYNSVILKNDKGSLQADEINYNFNTKIYKISMFDKEKIKLKLTR